MAESAFLMNRSKNQIRNTGFSLLEILVAFAILMLTLSAIFKVYSTAARSLAISNEYAEAIRIAESILAKSGRSDALQPGQDTGVVKEEYQWIRIVHPTQWQLQQVTQPAGNIRRNQRRANLMEVEVVIRWRSGGKIRSIDLHTIKPVLNNGI